MRIRTLAVLGLIAAVGFGTAAADDKKAEFKEFASKEGKFKAKFPGEVKTGEMKTGADFTVYTAKAEPGPGQVYQVSYFDTPAAIPADQAKEVLRQTSKGIAGPKGKILKDEEVEVGKDKLPGRDVVVEQPAAHLRQRTVIAGTRLYMVTIGGPTKEFVTSKDADRFIESFQITK